jgi:hypothetical protein
MANLKHLVGKQFNLMHRQSAGFNVITSGVVKDIVGDKDKLAITRLGAGRDEEFGFESPCKVEYGNCMAIVTYNDGSQAFLDFF